MKVIAANAIKSSYFLLDNDRKLHNFEIFGLDFMIDEQFQPWLIEVNTNPCLELGCPLLARLIPNMVENALKYWIIDLESGWIPCFLHHMCGNWVASIS